MLVNARDGVGEDHRSARFSTRGVDSPVEKFWKIAANAGAARLTGSVGIP